MLLHVEWDLTDQTEEGEKRSLSVFAEWKPPEGFEFQGFYAYADGRGGVAIVEAENEQAIARALAPWTPWLSFNVRPILDIEEGVAIAQEAIAFRDSVS